MRRPGFTLIEVMIAVVVTGIVVALAYSTAQAGFDIDRRLARHRAGADAETTMRSMLDDALRHALPGLRGGEAVFSLADRAFATGVPNDSLRFLTRGVLPPLGTSAAWVVTVSVDGDGLSFDARPASVLDEEAPVAAHLAGVRGLDVRALGAGAGTAWRRAWEETDVAPDAVSLTFIRGNAAKSARGAGEAPSLVARLGLERRR
jgi:prepilin-type N-terminal cleavage/methylation domain-containing protein